MWMPTSWGPRLHGGDQAPPQGLGVPEQQSRYEFFGPAAAWSDGNLYRPFRGQAREKAGTGKYRYPCGTTPSCLYKGKMKPGTALSSLILL
jgi:hypothetical protein